MKWVCRRQLEWKMTKYERWVTVANEKWELWKHSSKRRHTPGGSINVVTTVKTMFIENERSCDVATTWKIEQQLLIWLSSLCEWKYNEWILQDTQFDHLDEVSTTRNAFCCLCFSVYFYISISIYSRCRPDLDIWGPSYPKYHLC